MSAPETPTQILPTVALNYSIGDMKIPRPLSYLPFQALSPSRTGARSDSSRAPDTWHRIRFTE